MWRLDQGWNVEWPREGNGLKMYPRYHHLLQVTAPARLLWFQARKVCQARVKISETEWIAWRSFVQEGVNPPWL
jgi:hypothetical protein